MSETIAVATMGDPRNPTTWSGTAAHIVRELEAMGIRVEGIDIRTVGKLEQAFWYGVYQIWRMRPQHLLHPAAQIALMRSNAKSDANLMWRVRNRRARELEKKAHQRGVKRILHMIPYSIPVGPVADLAFEHHLILDSTFHLEMLQQPDRNTRRNPAIDRAFLDNEKRLFANVKHFFPIAEYLRDDLMETYGIDPARITVIGTGLGGIEPFRGVKDYRNGHILCTAKARFEEKGGPLLIEAFQIAHRANPSLRLVIVGQDFYREKYAGIAGLTVLGHVSWNQLQELFQEAALYAMPAPSEPWGLVYLEALASRVPILGLRRNAFPEIADGGRHGFIVEHESAESVAQALLDAMSDPARLKRMGEAGQAFCLEKFTWGKTAQRLAQAMTAPQMTPMETNA